MNMARISESVLRAAQKINKLLTIGGDEWQLTPRQIDILLILADEPGLSQVDIMERCSMDRSTMSSVVTLMQKKGLIERTRSKEDGRAFEVELTQEGRALVKQCKRIREDVESTLEGNMRQPGKTLADLIAITEISTEVKK